MTKITSQKSLLSLYSILLKITFRHYEPEGWAHVQSTGELCWAGLSAWHELESCRKRDNHLNKKSPLDWLVGKCVGHFLITD